MISWQTPRITAADTALHNGDAGPRVSLWSHRDPVTLIGFVLSMGALLAFMVMEGADPTSLPVMGVVAESGCRYFGEVRYPQDVRVGLSVVRVGTSSVTYRPALFAQDDDVPAAVGRWVHVYVDRDTRRPVPVPDVLRSALHDLQGG